MVEEDAVDAIGDHAVITQDVHAPLVAVPVDFRVESQCTKIWAGEEANKLDKCRGPLMNVDNLSYDSPLAVKVEELERVDGHREGVNKAAIRLLSETRSVEMSIKQ